MSKLKIAKSYVHDRGWSVIPIRPNGKAPAIAWKQYTERFPTDDELETWFSRGKYNIGIVTGPISGIVVIDDDREKNGIKAAPLEAIYPTDLIAKTASGGKHLFYAYDKPLNNSVSLLEDHVDVRARGGLVVAAGSSVDGNDYTWVNDAAPSPLPEAWIKRLERKQREEIIGIDIKNHVAFEQDGAELYQRVLRQGFKKGEHNQELLMLAKYLYKVHGYDRVTTTEILRILDLKDATPQSDTGEFTPTITSAFEYMDTFRTHKKEKLSVSRSVDVTVHENNEPLNLVSLDEFGSKWQDYFTTYQIDQWIPDRSILFMVSPPESFKTWLLLDMAVSTALGHKGAKFLGGFGSRTHEKMEDKEPQSVIIVQQEDFHGELWKRLQLILNIRSQEVIWDCVENPDGSIIFEHPLTATKIYLHTEANFRLDDAEAMQAMDQKLEQTGAKLVLVDPFYSITDMSQNFGASAAADLGVIKKMREKHGTSFVFAHHSKKAGDGSSRLSASGSNFINAAMEGAMMIEKVGLTSIRVTRTGKFFDGAKTWTLNFDINDGADGSAKKFDVEILEGVTGTDLPPVQQQIIDILSEIPAGLSAKEIADLVGKDRSNLTRSGGDLKTLIEEGLIIYERPKYKIPLQMEMENN